MSEIPLPIEPEEVPSSGMEVIVHPTLGQQGRDFQKIVRYVEGLKDGLGARDAAKAAGTTHGAMKLQGKAVQRYLAKARAEYTADAAELRELTVLKWVERALRDPGDPNFDARETMLALREISAIPEVGLKGKAEVKLNGQRVFSEEAQAVLDQVEEQLG